MSTQARSTKTQATRNVLAATMAVAQHQLATPPVQAAAAQVAAAGTAPLYKLAGKPTRGHATKQAAAPKLGMAWHKSAVAGPNLRAQALAALATLGATFTQAQALAALAQVPLGQKTPAARWGSFIRNGFVVPVL